LHSYVAVQPALAAIWLSVVFGAALGVGQRWAPRVTDPIRTFAVVAAALVVSLSLLPHALACEGMAGLAGAGLGYVAIPALERLGTALFRRADPHAVRLELGYSGLLLHRFGDGVAMSVAGHGYGVLWALGAHEVPIVALVTLAFARRGLGVALWRAAALGLSSSLGFWLVSALSATSWHALHGWADAIAAGVLVHIVAHEGLAERAELPPGAARLAPARRSAAQRGLDLAAAVLACVLIGVLGLDDDSGAAQVLERMLQIALQSAPWLCLGLVCRTTLRLWSERAAGERTRFWPALQRAAAELAGWTLLGLLAATYAAAFIGKDPGGFAAPARVGWSALATALAFASAPAAAPVAAALVSLGLPFGAALAVLLLGPLAKLLSARGTSLSAAARSRLVSTTLGGAALAAALLVDLSRGGSGDTRSGLPGPVHWLLLAALLALLGLGTWTTGVRNWLQAGLAPRAAHGQRAGHAHAWPGHT
jgi:hypothetical protein